ncbi:MAG: helix-turn-helix domain-containing protein, partial [Steroidobacteraceae bacterium]
MGSRSSPGATGPTSTAPRTLASISDLERQLGGTLRALRLDRNLDQARLAERAGVSLNALKRLERARGS